MGLVDHEAILADFEAFLIADGRHSHGTDFLLRQLAELRAKHRRDETAEQAFLRHFQGHLTDTFFGLLPGPATGDPLTVADPPEGTAEAMVRGATTDQHQTEGDGPCQTHRPPPSRASSKTPGNRVPAAASC